jgi:hypothetical protein
MNAARKARTGRSEKTNIKKARDEGNSIDTFYSVSLDGQGNYVPGDDQSRFIQLYAKEILPRLRQHWG